MSARKRGRKSSRVSKNSGALKKARGKLARFLVDLEVPLNEALDAAHALRFIGYGLVENGLRPEGRAVTSLAWTARERLETLEEICERMGREG